MMVGLCVSSSRRQTIWNLVTGGKTCARPIGCAIATKSSGSVRQRMVRFYRQKTAYEMETRDWSADVCSSDLKFILMPINDCQLQRVQSIRIDRMSVV